MNLGAILISVVAIAAWIWLFFFPVRRPNRPQDDARAERARLIGLLSGFTGGGIRQAALAQYALDRFEQQHGRPATSEDIAVLVGLMQSHG